MSNDSTLKPLPKAYSTIEISSIIVPDRIRSADDKTTEANVKALVDSIREYGLIQPIVLEEDERTLRTGWCRLQALTILGYKEVPFNVLPAMSESDKLVVEYEENDARSDMSWQDKVCAVAKIHRLKTAEAGGDKNQWGQTHTGRLLGVSQAQVSYCVILDKAIRSGDTFISEADGLNEALKRLVSRREDELQRELSKRNAQVQQTTLPKIRKEGSGEISSGLTISVQQLDTVPTKPTEAHLELDERFTIKVSDRLFHGNMLEVCKGFHDESFDLIFTDIPYGVDPTKFKGGMDNIEDIEVEHQVADFLSDCPKWIETMFRVLKKDSYCMFFYDLEHHEKIVDWSIAAGFKPQPFPFHWVKTHSCTNRVPQYHHTKSVEHVMILRKGAPTLRDNSYFPNYFLADGSVDRALYKHPFFKPYAVCERLLRKVAFRGMTMLDPFAGEGSILRAGIVNGLVPFGVEMSATWFPLLQESFKTAYSSVYKSYVSFE